MSPERDLEDACVTEEGDVEGGAEVTQPSVFDRVA